MNAFFSGSVKNMETLPCFYPANIHHYVNGTEFDPNTLPVYDYTSDMQYSMEGYIQKADYSQLLQKKWFGLLPPSKAGSFNTG
jgi:hypothetical protein